MTIPIPAHLARLEWYARHQAWLRVSGLAPRHDPGKAIPVRANLAEARFERAELHDADLRYARMYAFQARGVWLQRADLRGANLNMAFLPGACLHNVDVSGADLNRARLRLAHLDGSTFFGTEMWAADLRGAKTEHAIGLVPMPVADTRGNQWFAVAYPDGWRVSADFNWFTIAEARAHLLSPDYRGPLSVGETVAAALDWLEKQPLPDMGEGR